MSTAIPAARAVAASKIYGSGDAEVRALDAIDVEFARGAFTAIMGPSGSGKSTLLHVLAGLDTVTSGQVFIGDVTYSHFRHDAHTHSKADISFDHIRVNGFQGNAR